MTHKKGGGRESGGTDGGNRGAVRETSAAAYPADIFCPQAGLRCAVRYQECLRALEADLDVLKARVGRILVTADGSPAEARAIRWLREEVANDEASR